MGKISQGILGGFSGKVGNVIGGNWKGIDYMRVKPASVANPQTEGQMDQRSKFSAVIGFLQPISEFIKIGFKSYAVKMTAFNSAMSYNVKNALTGDYPDYEVDYANALVSRGSLATALNPTAVSGNVGEVTFSWNDNSTEGNANATDKAMLVALNPTKKEAVFVTDGVARSVGTQTLTVPASYSGDNVECFISFISLDGTVSNSKYVGTVTVALPR
ncbi:MAG: hypothetical protein A2W90_13270 [Bacteroidetes bacterium GWF2_42_66]|nr:MAG: hypothetical protein A2W92_19220 [Bacteroidetes bacterium GWA2_42_15]OFY00186.1 MAG: hypothetical protein A2W89_18260 [Bacteroidetes bacterium GWE2_42_39]OFY40327.1 MAG: hypothetical protein A2W90_13270 [Bacteroidetes bacterium GWF2_42_66]HBL73686.1 hypothetical protein [Prolixibacteraceae bacterium]HCR90696.1 hypothetical protein [Prolixibacteraceae bacterium]